MNTTEKVYQYIESYIIHHNMSPTYREIGAGCDISSTSVVYYHIKKLESADRIKNQSGSIRGISIPGLSTSEYKYLYKTPKKIRRNLTKKEHKKVINKFDGKCLYCMKSADLVVDHFYPLAKHGADKLYNMVPCCRDCNLDKRDNDPIDWILENYNMETLTRVMDYLFSGLR